MMKLNENEISNYYHKNAYFNDTHSFVHCYERILNGELIVWCCETKTSFFSYSMN